MKNHTALAWLPEREWFGFDAARGRTWWAMLVFAAVAAGSAPAQTGRAFVRHAPSVNGAIQGSVQQMLGETVTFNSGANVAGDLYVIGSPTVQLNGSPTYGGTQDGTGSASPSNYSITLNSAATLGHVIRRTNALSWPTIATVPSPTATGSVTVTSSGQSVNWSTTRNLTLNSGVGQFAVPAGTYGDFIANNNSGFTLGVAGATTPAVYNFQNLTFNSVSKLLVVGPVVINVANGFAPNSTVGNSANPGWLSLNIRTGGLSLNSNSNVYGYVVAPSGTVIINNGTQLVGGVTSDYLTASLKALSGYRSSAERPFTIRVFTTREWIEKFSKEPYKKF
jgi:rhamnogalacturonan endolyase